MAAANEEPVRRRPSGPTLLALLLLLIAAVGLAIPVFRLSPRESAWDKLQHSIQEYHHTKPNTLPVAACEITIDAADPGQRVISGTITSRFDGIPTFFSVARKQEISRIDPVLKKATAKLTLESLLAGDPSDAVNISIPISDIISGSFSDKPKRFTLPATATPQAFPNDGYSADLLVALSVSDVSILYRDDQVG